MRQLGNVPTPEEAYTFQKYLKSQGIDLLIDPVSEQKKKVYYLWVIQEDQLPAAFKEFEAYKQNPTHPRYFIPGDEKPDEEEVDASKPKVVLKSSRIPILTWFWILLTAIVYFINVSQEITLVEERGLLGAQVSLTAVQETLFLDVPKGYTELGDFLKEHEIRTDADLAKLNPQTAKQWQDLQETAYYRGYLDLLENPDYAASFKQNNWPLFSDVREGEIYRLFTPVFLHGSLLHIVLNMVWLYVLMKQVEMKIGFLKTLFLGVSLGVVANVAQYLVSGPFFLGASGVVIGLTTFIWARQKKAPWEGYFLSRMIIFFLLIYVLALVALSIGVFVFNLETHKNLSFGIANTAHVVGGVLGFALGSCQYFRRR